MSNGHDEVRDFETYHSADEARRAGGGDRGGAGTRRHAARLRRTPSRAGGGDRGGAGTGGDGGTAAGGADGGDGRGSDGGVFANLPPWAPIAGIVALLALLLAGGWLFGACDREPAPVVEEVPVAAPPYIVPVGDWRVSTDFGSHASHLAPEQVDAVGDEPYRILEVAISDRFIQEHPQYPKELWRAAPEGKKSVACIGAPARVDAMANKLDLGDELIVREIEWRSELEKDLSLLSCDYVDVKSNFVHVRLFYLDVHRMVDSHGRGLTALAQYGLCDLETGELREGRWDMSSDRGERIRQLAEDIGLPSRAEAEKKYEYSAKYGWPSGRVCDQGVKALVAVDMNAGLLRIDP